MTTYAQHMLNSKCSTGDNHGEKNNE